jgi:PAS domain S-box-containing protein
VTSEVWRIVIIDDSPDDRAEIRRLLLFGSERRYRFIEAETGDAGADAILNAEDGPIDCVVLDYNLPDATALDVLARLTIEPGIPICPIVILTGSSTQDMIAGVLRAGAQDYIGKSWITTEGLTRALENAVERYALLRQLRKSEARLSNAVEAAGFIAWEVDLSTASEWWNGPISRTFDVSSGMGERLFDGPEEFVHPEDRAFVGAAFQASIETSTRFDCEFRVVRPDGQTCWLAIHGDTSRGPAGSIERVVGVVQDVTERKKNEEELSRYAKELKDADHRKDEFLAMLAHELRNPLAPIRSAVQILRNVNINQQQGIHTLDMIERQVIHMTRLVDDLLDVSRINEGKVVLKQHVVDVKTVVNAAVDLVRPFVDAKRHRLRISVPHEALYIQCDVARMTQVVGNLLNNAAKYTDAEGEIGLFVEFANDRVLLRVTDNGIGIAPDLLPHIFDLFIQAERTIDRSQGGLGIGLSLVKNLVALHNGAVEVVSAGLGKGSEFKIHLPLVAQPRTEPVEATSTVLIEPRRILVVDDNVDSAESIGMLLQMDGHTVRYAHEGHEALSAAIEMRPQVALLDIGLPGMDGYELAQALRSQPETQDTFLIALTGYGRDEDRIRSTEAGFDVHFVKPVDPGRLSEIIAKSRASALYR